MIATVITKTVGVLGAEDAAEYLGGMENLKRLVKAGWLKPLGGKSKGMDYSAKALELALDRVELEGWPPL